MADRQQSPETGTLRDRIHEFVLQQFPLAAQLAANDGDSLLDNGIVDSLGILEIVTFLTERWGIVVDDDELLPENFDSIASLTGFVERKLGPEAEA